MARTEFGTWEVTMPEGTIEHGSRGRCACSWTMGGSSIAEATLDDDDDVEQGVMGRRGIRRRAFWNPEEKYEFKHSSPKKPEASAFASLRGARGRSANDPKAALRVSSRRSAP